MASGVGINDQCLDTYQELKAKHLHRYVIFKLADNNKEIVVDQCGCKSSSYEDFTAKLKEAADRNECRYAVYDVEKEVGGVMKSKIVFITWSPDTTSVKPKMLYASSLRPLKAKLGIELVIQCNDMEDLAWSNILEKCIDKYQ